MRQSSLHQAAEMCLVCHTLCQLFLLWHDGATNLLMSELLTLSTCSNCMYRATGACHVHVLQTECTRVCTGPALLQRYKYFVVINNGMRGPFATANQGMEQHHWTQPFINKLNSHVRHSLSHLTKTTTWHACCPSIAWCLSATLHTCLFECS